MIKKVLTAGAPTLEVQCVKHTIKFLPNSEPNYVQFALMLYAHKKTS